MAAIEKTKKLLRIDLPVGLLVPNEDNPNKMSSREFDLLVSNFEDIGFADAILCRPFDLVKVQQAWETLNPGDFVKWAVEKEIKFKIVGGHHRHTAAVYLGFETVPCTVIMDPAFDEDREKFQLVRMNMIKGKLDPNLFFSLYQQLADQYSDEILQESFGFAEEAEFKKLINQLSKQLPEPHLQQKFKEAAAEIKTVDGLSKLLNEMFTKYGDTLPFGFMVFDHAGQRSMWLRIEGKTMKALDVIGTICIDNDRTVDDVVGGLLQELAKGEFKEYLDKIVKKAPAANLPKNLPVAPTKENLEKVAGS